MKRKRRGRLKIKNILLFLLLLILLPTSITIISKSLSDKVDNNELIEEDFGVKEYTASLIMVGDALVHNSLYNDANRIADYNGYD